MICVDKPVPDKGKPEFDDVRATMDRMRRQFVAPSRNPRCHSSRQGSSAARIDRPIRMKGPMTGRMKGQVDAKFGTERALARMLGDMS